MPYKVKDISLAKKGELQIEYAAMQMKPLMEIKKRFLKEKPLKGLRIGIALHVTKETANLVRVLVDGGAKVAIASCNPLSTQDDVAAALAKFGVNVYAWKGETREEYYDNLNRILDFKPNITIDDGCDLIALIHRERQNLIDNIFIGTEETTTGVLRLRAMEENKILKYPVIAVNENKTKYLFDNYYGTGQSTIDGLLRATNVLLAGKNFVVCGYGYCGKGVALRAKGMGSNVIITEVDEIKALQARMDGFSVMPIAKASAIGDIFVTVTGNKNVIRKEHFLRMKDGAILANAGHFNVEIDVNSLEKIAKSKRKVREFLDEYSLPNGKRIYLCAEGRLVNLVAAEGHPSEVMSLSFCGQALAIEYGIKNKLSPKVYNLPEEVDKKIAYLYLKTNKIDYDILTAEQKKYLNFWMDGT